MFVVLNFHSCMTFDTHTHGLHVLHTHTHVYFTATYIQYWQLVVLDYGILLYIHTHHPNS